MPEAVTTTHEHAAHPALQHHFENMEQQREAGTLGMWVFLVTEIMFFGGMFLAYTLYRYKYPDAFAAASNHLDIKLGAINTVVLIVSSFTMAMAVFSTQVGRRRSIDHFSDPDDGPGRWRFSVSKPSSIATKYNDHLIPGQLIPGHPFNPEVAKHGDTDPHKLHLPEGAIGQTCRDVLLDLFRDDRHARAAHDHRRGIMLVILIMAWRGKFSPEYHAPVEISGLVLALCRYRLDLSVSVAVSAGTALGRTLRTGYARRWRAFRLPILETVYWPARKYGRQTIDD